MLDCGIKGKAAIVCGSSRGLGKACATSLVNAGASVLINGIDPDRLQRAVDELAPLAQERGGAVKGIAADVTTPEGQGLLLEACPNPDILVTNAAGPPPADFRQLDREAIIKGLGSNMISPIEMIQKVIDGMTERQFGRIVNITSISVKMPVASLDLSSGARAGLTSFLAGIARSVAHANVTINNILPGFFDTDRFRNLTAKWAERENLSLEAALEARAANVPAKRIGDPREFGDACAFLCSASAGYITGQNLLMDGGAFPSAF